MNLLQFTTGGVTTRGAGSIDVAAFYRRRASGKLLPMLEAERDQQSEIKSIGTAEVTPSGAASTGKKWIDKRNDFPEGSFVKINVRVTSVKLRFSHTIHNLYIRMRSTGPLTELAIACPTDEQSSRSRVYYIGRFDILTPEEVEELKLHIGTNGGSELATYEPVLESTVFEVEVKEKGRAKAPTKTAKVVIESKSGTRKVMPKLRMARRIGLPPS